MAATPDVIKVRIEPEFSDDFAVLFGAATNDAVEKVNAGAALVYALYHLTAEEALALPATLTAPLVRAQEAYGVRRTRKDTAGG